jgi:hypothetical protein
MRPIERISKFFECHTIDRLHDHGKLSNHEFINISTNYDKIKEYWKTNPDQRFFQVLINLGICEDKEGRWFKEDLDILMEYNVYLGDVIRWTSYYDKEGKLLKTPKTRYIQDLDTDHLHAIRKFAKDRRRTLHPTAEYCISKELEKRNES